MNDSDGLTELVEQAKGGDKESLDSLAERVRGRLAEYVYRMTLREDMTQDIVQETMLVMFKVLGKLEKSDRFWPWLRRIAFNQVCDIYRDKRQRKEMQSQLPRDFHTGQAAPARRF